MGSLCGSNTQTSTTTQAPPAWLQDAYQQLIAQAQGVSNNIQGAPGPTVAGLDQNQINAISGISNTVGTANPYFSMGLQALQGGLGTVAGGLGYLPGAANLFGTAQGQYGVANQYLGQAGSQYGAANNMIGSALPYFGQGASYASQGAAPINAMMVSPGTVSPTSFAGGDALQQYMSPYQQNVIDTTLANIQHNNQVQRNDLTGSAILGGNAFGGDRAGVAQAELARGQDAQTNATLASLNNQNYAQALGEFNQQQGVNLGAQEYNVGTGLQGQEFNSGQNLTAQQSNMARLLQASGLYGQMGQGVGSLAGLQSGIASGLGGLGSTAAGIGSGLGSLGSQYAGLGSLQAGIGSSMGGLGSQIAGLGPAQQSSQLQALQALLQGGTLAQQNQQQQATSQYQAYLNSIGLGGLQTMAPILSGIGSLGGGTGTTTAPGPNMLSQLGSLGMAGVGMAAMLSDERVKENIATVGKTFDGQPIYRFNYKGDPQTQVGLIAQDVERHHPSAVHEVGGLKTVNYDEATRSAAHRGHFDDGGAVNDLYGLGSLSTLPMGLPGHMRITMSRGPGLPHASTPSQQEGGLADMTKAFQQAAPVFKAIKNAPGNFGGSPETNQALMPIDSPEAFGGRVGLGELQGYATDGSVDGFADRFGGDDPVDHIGEDNPMTPLAYAGDDDPTKPTPGYEGLTVTYNAPGQKPDAWTNKAIIADRNSPPPDPDNPPPNRGLGDLQTAAVTKSPLPPPPTVPPATDPYADAASRVRRRYDRPPVEDAYSSPSDRPTLGKPDPWMALAAAGFAGMAARSPWALTNLGEAGLAGLKNYSEQKEQAQKQYSVDLRAKQLADESKQHYEKMGLESQRIDIAQQTADEMAAVRQAQAQTPKVISQDVMGNSVYGIPDPKRPGRWLNPLTGAPIDQAPEPGGGGQAIGPLPSAGEAMAKKIASYDYPSITGFAAIKSKAGQAIMGRAFELNPDLDVTHYNEKQKVVKDFSTGKQGDKVTFFNNSIQHLTTLDGLIEAMNNSNFKIPNAISNAFKEQFGYTAPGTFDAAKNVVGQEIIKSIVANGGGEREREEAARTLAAAKSPEQLRSIINVYKELGGAQLRDLKLQYETGSGLKNFDGKLIPESRQELEKVMARAAAREKPISSPAAGSSVLPAAAKASLKEGTITTFGNGQKWTLKNGVPQRVE